jgi:predicted ATP-grasp superfamily ATP-dependent carboligase
VLNGSPIRVLVTDAHTTTALAVVRSLGAAGMDVTIVGEHGRFNLAAHSRYARRVVTCAPAEEEPLAYVDQIVRDLERSPVDLLIPLSDTTVTIFRHFRARVEKLARLALPSDGALEAALDKQRTVAVAKEYGVIAPGTRAFGSLAALEEAAPSLTYPCVVKPRYSRQWDGSGAVIRGTVRYAASPASLREIYRAARQGPEFLLVQELVQGTGLGVFVLADEGRPLAVFAHRRVREANPTGGRASLAESIALDDRIAGPALRLFEALRWTGVGMLEFKDPGPGQPPVIMEINGRFWGSLPLAIAAGVDFPLMLVRLLLGQEVPQPGPYTVGVRCRHLKGDLSYLTGALKGRPRGWLGPFPSRLSAIAAVVPWPGRWRAYNFRVTDPIPGLREAGDFLLKEARALTARRRARTVESPSPSQ